LDEFEKQGYLNAHNRKFLQTALEAGHAAAHRGHDGGEAVLNTTMDIVENLVHAVFVLGNDEPRFPFAFHAFQINLCGLKIVLHAAAQP
jgi:hypothetical protein